MAWAARMWIAAPTATLRTGFAGITVGEVAGRSTWEVGCQVGVVIWGGAHPLPSPPPGRGRGLLMRCPIGARLVWGVGFLDSGFRRNDGWGQWRWLQARMWIPAFAGMTIRGGRELQVGPRPGFLDSGLRRNDGFGGVGGWFGWGKVGWGEGFWILRFARNDMERWGMTWVAEMLLAEVFWIPAFAGMTGWGVGWFGWGEGFGILRFAQNDMGRCSGWHGRQGCGFPLSRE